MVNRLYAQFGKTTVRVVAAVLVLAVLAFIFLGGNAADQSAETAVTSLPEVSVSTVDALRTESSFTVVGSVTAISEARLQAEAGGRITNVAVALGDSVSAGTVLASIENSAERAQLLQAEGAYESSLASSLQSGSSLDEARITVRNTYRDTFSTTDTVVRTIVDQFYSNPGEQMSGFKLAGTGRATEFLDMRREIETQLLAWSETIAANYGNSTEEELLSESEEVITEVSNLMVTFVYLLSDDDIEKNLTDEDRAAYQADLARGRASLDGALSAVSAARQGYEQAVISGSGSSEGVSGASAQQKSALGTLRSAQAAYEKTLIRTPISGVVNALYIKTGEYVTNGQAAALVANNGSLEVSASLGEADLSAVTVGDTVLIDEIISGTVTRVAPAVDPLSGKAEVKVSVDDAATLTNGSTVRVTFSRTVTTERSESELGIPLSALKLLPSGPVVFSVNDEGVLVSHPVTLGRILGDTVLVTEGLTNDFELVIDARGLKEGDKVTVSE